MVDDGRGGEQQGGVLCIPFPSALGYARGDIRVCTDTNVERCLLNVRGIKQSCENHEREPRADALHGSLPVRSSSIREHDVIDLVDGENGTSDGSVRVMVHRGLREIWEELERGRAFRIKMDFPPLSCLGVALHCFVQMDAGAERNLAAQQRSTHSRYRALSQDAFSIIGGTPIPAVAVYLEPFRFRAGATLSSLFFLFSASPLISSMRFA
jgi:hypothetical protein